MKYYRQNTLIIEYPSGNFLAQQTIARISWAVAWTELSGDKVRIIDVGQPMTGKWRQRGYRHKKRIILIDFHCTKPEFIDAISRFFSQKLQVNPSQLRFRFKEFTPFGDLNEN